MHSFSFFLLVAPRLPMTVVCRPLVSSFPQALHLAPGDNLLRFNLALAQQRLATKELQRPDSTLPDVEKAIVNLKYVMVHEAARPFFCRFLLSRSLSFFLFF